MPLTSKNNKHKGSALLITVLVAFLVLAILSAAAFSIAGQTKKTELWQMNYKKQMLTDLARSAVITVTEAISADREILDHIDETANSADISLNGIADMTIAVSADTGSIVTVSVSAKKDKQSVKISGRWNKDSGNIVGWRENDK